MSEGFVLIVDDNPNNLTLLRQILQEAGYDVRAANSGRRALQLVERQTPELILLDVQMPEMDGYEVCRRLKQAAASGAVPVIFVSALDEVSDKVKGFEVGGVDYVTKPYQPAEVLARTSCQIRLARLQRQLEAANAELLRLSTTDPLTGLANRRKVIEAADAEIALATRHSTPFTFVILDVDRFKRVNDTFGHSAGDDVLRHVARTIQASVRTSDLAARWGGEEFVVLLRHTDIEAGAQLAEKLRAALEASPVEPVGAVTASFGVAEYRAGEPFAALSARADEQLYRAKSEGRNRVARAGSGP